METEILAEQAILEIKGHVGKNIQVLDLCTGSGCIALAISKNTDAVVTASDVSEDAYKVAKLNLSKSGAAVVLSDLFTELGGKKFDVIVSNPPYIKSADIADLQTEVKDYDPVLALDGGEDGLDFYKKIIAESPKYLNKGGVVLFEVGQGQATDVKDLLKKDFTNCEVVKDLTGIERVVKGVINNK